ncbi:hypothetical protein P154DRAFT_560200 [Amniculicola lignicola CBS 123094]|uniref:Uncharacterized protein n=1 Tax=Amniculicola lignicola CBS 123094 TaxID=1392246 RepID=A0A6A5WUM9_9PLEO|nr:hypothetical protein P154DRAFT_560200 [Amniculicola lignicola CBS 123094]
MSAPRTPQKSSQKRPATSPLDDKRTPFERARAAINDAEALHASSQAKQAQLEQELKIEKAKVAVLQHNLKVEQANARARITGLKRQLEIERGKNQEGKEAIEKLERIKREFGLDRFGEGKGNGAGNVNVEEQEQEEERNWNVERETESPSTIGPAHDPSGNYNLDPFANTHPFSGRMTPGHLNHAMIVKPSATRNPNAHSISSAPAKAPTQYPLYNNASISAPTNPSMFNSDIESYDFSATRNIRSTNPSISNPTNPPPLLSNPWTNNGTRDPTFQAYQWNDPQSEQREQFPNITFQNAFRKFSVEELRAEDYKQGRRYGDAASFH